MPLESNALDKVLLAVAPRWALDRIRARAIAGLIARHYEAAASGRRTQNWPRRYSDANMAAGSALSALRAHSRDLIRNNGWARNGRRVISRNIVGWGITPKVPEPIRARWNDWAETTACDATGRATFAGLQKLIANTVVESGEAIIRRRWRRPSDGLPIPMQLQVLEPDHIDSTQNDRMGQEGGPIVQGIEFDAIGRRVAYWLFDKHPGSTMAVGDASRRIPASEIIHVYDLERAGQDRGVPWLAVAILKLKDFDEFEDATLMRQKIAACFAAFVTDIEGSPTALAEQDTQDEKVETLEPGLISHLPTGKQVTFGNPPVTTEDGFSARTLRGIASGIGVTYEDLTQDYSQVNFSSARMARIAHWANVYDWQWNMLVPQFCDPAWAWVMEVALQAGFMNAAAPRPRWTPQPMAMTDPDKEARANLVRIRSGQATLSEVIREMGRDPDEFLDEYAADLKKLDDRKIWLDSDVRRVTAAGLEQAAAKPTNGAGSGGEMPPKPPPAKAAGKGNGVA